MRMVASVSPREIVCPSESLIWRSDYRLLSLPRDIVYSWYCLNIKLLGVSNIFLTTCLPAWRCSYHHFTFVMLRSYVPLCLRDETFQWCQWCLGRRLETLGPSRLLASLSLWDLKPSFIISGGKLWDWELFTIIELSMFYIFIHHNWLIRCVAS